MRLDVGARARFTRFGSFEILLDLTFEMHTFTSRERSFQRLAQFKTTVIPPGGLVGGAASVSTRKRPSCAAS
jgi:hypothetical protein